MKVIAVVICAIPFLTVASLAYATPTVEVQNGPKVLYGDPACGGGVWTFDSYTLVIKESENEIAHYHFCSSVAVRTAELVTDNIGRSYAFLQYHTGHGTPDVLVQHLVVFEVPLALKKYDLSPYLTVVTSASAGPESRWKYQYQVEKLACGGLRLVLTREIKVFPPGAKVEGVPREKLRTIDVGVPLHCKNGGWKRLTEGL